MVIQLYDVNNDEYITEFEIDGDLTDAIMVVNEITHYYEDGVQYNRANNKIGYNLTSNSIEIQVERLGE